MNRRYVCVRSYGYKIMTDQDNTTTVCDLPTFIAFPANDSAFFVNDVVAAGVNASLSVFAFLSSLLVIITVAKTPSLQRLANILLCSLAATDCLTGATTQPLLSIWRLMLYRARDSCYLQTEFFQLRFVLTTLTLGWSLAILTLISFDRARALSNPLVYRTEVTNKGSIKAAIITTASWLLVTIILHASLSESVRTTLQMIFAVLFILLPAINHIRMFLAIRHHNSQMVGQVGTQQLSVLLKREKKVAADMVIVVLVLIACIGPGFGIHIVSQVRSLEIRGYLEPWTLMMLYLNSSINPFLHLTRNRELRNALRSVVRPSCLCC